MKVPRFPTDRSVANVDSGRPFSRHSKRSLLFMLGTASVVMVLLAGCASSTPSAASTAASGSPQPSTAQSSSGPAPASVAPSPKTGGTLIMARNQDPVSMNPLQDTGNGSIFVWAQIYEGLVTQVPGEKDPQPAVASSWDIAPDGLTYTFHLQSGPKFSNGDPVTAEDVKFSLEQLMDPKLGADWNFEFLHIKDVVVVDPATVRLDMKSVDAELLSALTEPAAGILPMKYVQSVGQDGFASKPIGSGPFMLKNWIHGQEVDLVRNPNYWRTGQPYLDGITMLDITDSNARLLKVESGGADVGETVPVSQLARLNSVAGLKVLQSPAWATWQVFFNFKTKPLDELAVRQALNYATPKDAINSVVLGGIGVTANSTLARTEYWDSTIPPYAYDLAKAKQLLATSSTPTGFTLPLMIQAGDAAVQNTATILQTEWAKIGVNVKISVVDGATYGTKWQGGEYGAVLFPTDVITSDLADDNELGSTIMDYTGCCQAFWTFDNDPASSALVQKADGTTDPAQRQALYSQLQKYGMDNAQTDPLFYVPYLTAVRDNVQGFSVLPSGWWVLRLVSLSQ